MYRQGLGDCFLLTFDTEGQERHMLIDCGTLGSKSTKVKIKHVAEHVFQTIGDGNLDCVVATHEHQDHLSGFNGPLKELQGRVENVWLAWTENPADKDAQALTKHRGDMAQALAMVVEAAPESEVGSAVADLLGFAGRLEDGPLNFAKTVNRAMEFVRTGLGVEARYCEPGQVFEEDWLPGFRFYILGPPRDKKLIKEMGGHHDEELYGLTGLTAASLRHLAVEQQSRSLSPEERLLIQNERPFDARFSQTEPERNSSYPGYSDAELQWRSIEFDWLNLTSHLALQLDSLTNNTSLAFAVERIADGKVLLFPADAQLGNWKSWHADDLTWKVRSRSGREQELRARDLLARTVFYKVGHHASHNATARDLGLELMQEEQDLVAFVPVDRRIALSRNPKGSWKMPARPLYRRLLEKCQGRVARSDLGIAADFDGESEEGLQGVATEAEWIAWKESQDAANISAEELYIEYKLA